MSGKRASGALAHAGLISIFVRIEVVSKPQIMFESKAQADEKAQHTWQYVSILKRLATQLSDIRWGFQTTSNYIEYRTSP